MILSDGTMEDLLDPDRTTMYRRILMTPRPKPDDIQPASIDVHLGDRIEVAVPGGFRTVMLSKDPKKAWMLRQKMSPEDWWGPDWANLPAAMCMGDPLPDNLVLGALAATVVVPKGLVAVLDGVSTLARKGLSIHQTAGYIDPGFCGEITLEITMTGPFKIGLYDGMRIGQLRFHRLDAPARRPYGHPDRQSKYQNQTGPTPAR